MSWQGEFAFAPAALAFRGASAENRLHAHAALQCVASAHGILLEDAAGRRFDGPGWLVRSGVPHRLAPAPQLLLWLVEPQSPLARHLLQRVTAAPIAPLPVDLIERLTADQPLAALWPPLKPIQAGAVDRRVLSAIAFLDRVSSRNPSARAAAHAGLSPAQLRALCRAQFGIPFAKLVLWHKVRGAFQAMAAGSNLAAAAAAAGFADQAHLSRTMTEVIGLTPGQAARVAD